jgi:hypothetical protein
MELPRIEVPARMRRLSRDELARVFRQDMTAQVNAHDRETPAAGMLASVTITAAVALRCTAGDCHGLAGYMVHQTVDNGYGDFIRTQQYVAPASYVEREPGVYAPSNRARQRAKRGQDPRIARHKQDRRAVVASEPSPWFSQQVMHDIPGDGREIVVRCPDCKAANRWIRVDVAAALRCLDEAVPQR